MKSFKLDIVGFKVTEVNFKQAVKDIHTKYGLCPAIEQIVVLVAMAMTESNSSKSAFDKAYKKVIGMLGYSEQCYHNQMRKCC